MITNARISDLLAPFGIALEPSQLSQVSTYLDLTMRWNQRINLTSIRDPAECVTRHFGESLFLAKWMSLDGTHLDVGSGAGFPGLALKIAFPALQVTLLEPVAKKRAFLKEVARSCGMVGVDVRPERLSEYMELAQTPSFNSASWRAVGGLSAIIPAAKCFLTVGGKLCLWITTDQANDLARAPSVMRWN